ncbi:MAG: VWA domain-containing protein [Prevotella sp.]|nr:VWA domain-containing protein [Prevotella sp.]
MEFANKEYLFLLLLTIPYIIWYVMFRKKTEPTIRMADTAAFVKAPRSWRVWLMPVQPVLRLLAFVLLVLALARPQTHNSSETRSVEGIDIMLVVDVSTSMLTKDLEPNRILAARKVASEFISDRPDDNIGLTIFGGEAFTQCPMTLDHHALLSMLSGLDTEFILKNLVENGSTAIGMGLASALARLKDSKAKSRIVILLTDGTNNVGDITPMKAAEIAKNLGVRVYTVGVGTNGTALTPAALVNGEIQYLRLPVEIDTETLQQIAAMTDGKFYRATNNEELSQIYSEIDKLEKSKIDVQKFTRNNDVFQYFVLAALAALLLELLLRIIVFRRIP